MTAAGKKPQRGPHYRALHSMHRKLADHARKSDVFFGDARTHFAASRAEATKLLKTAGTIAKSNAAINNAVKNLHRSMSRDAALTQTEIRRLLSALGTTNGSMSGMRRDIAKVDRTLLTMAADMAAMRAHITTHGSATAASGLTAADIEAFKDVMREGHDAIREGHRHQQGRWDEDDRLAAIQTKLSQNAEEASDNKTDYEWWRSHIANRKQLHHSAVQTGRQQNSLAGFLLALEYGIANGLIVEPIRLGQWIKYRTKKDHFVREKESIKREMAKVRTPARTPAP